MKNEGKRNKSDKENTKKRLYIKKYEDDIIKK